MNPLCSLVWYWAEIQTVRSELESRVLLAFSLLSRTVVSVMTKAALNCQPVWRMNSRISKDVDEWRAVLEFDRIRWSGAQLHSVRLDLLCSRYQWHPHMCKDETLPNYSNSYSWEIVRLLLLSACIRISNRSNHADALRHGVTPVLICWFSNNLLHF